MLTLGQYVLVYLISIPIFAALDLIWLSVVARSFYQTRLAHLLSETVNWPAAIIFYLIFLLGVMIFAVLPALEARDMTKAFVFGALFGFFTYATYDLTNHATLREWPLAITIVDIAWGAVLAAVVSGATYWLALTFVVR